MRRREFVQQSALTGSLLLVSPSVLLRPAAKHIGVQLYSVRDEGDKDISGTLEKLAQMGYKELEGYTYENGLFHSFAPDIFKNYLRHLGMQMVSMHHGIGLKHWDPGKKMISDLAKKTIEDHAKLGVLQLINPSLDSENRNTSSLKKLCEIYNHFGEACRKSGIQFGHHNHDFEFKKSDGQYIMDILLQNTDPGLVKWELDLYWLSYAQEDPLQWINRYPGRISAFHVKDLAATPQRETAVVGEGVIDFKTIFAQKGASGVKYYIVELEHYKTTSLDGVKQSLINLKKLLA